MYTNEEIRKAIDADKAKKAQIMQDAADREAWLEARNAEMVKIKVEEYLRKYNILTSDEHKQEIIKYTIKQLKERGR